MIIVGSILLLQELQKNFTLLQPKLKINYFPMREIHKISHILKQPSVEEIKLMNLQVRLFIKAILCKDLPLLETLLHEKFTYFDTKSKWQTLEYFKEQFEKEIPCELKSDDVSIYFCKGCQPGNHALKFHCGYFPVLTDEVNMPKALMLSFKDGLVSDLTLCYGYCNAEKLQEIAIQN
jgi:hypothetical protein